MIKILLFLKNIIKLSNEYRGDFMELYIIQFFAPI